MATGGWFWEYDRSSNGLRALLGGAGSIGDAARPFVLAVPSSFPPSARRGHYREIVSLGLRKCYLGPAGAELVVQALRTSRPAAALGRLDLYHNRVGDSGATALVGYAVNGGGPGGFEAAGGASGGIKELLLGFNGLTHGCCKSIGAVLAGAMHSSPTNGGGAVPPASPPYGGSPPVLVPDSRLTSLDLTCKYTGNPYCEFRLKWPLFQ